jgi:hypothetical protein
LVEGKDLQIGWEGIEIEQGDHLGISVPIQQWRKIQLLGRSVHGRDRLGLHCVEASKNHRPDDLAAGLYLEAFASQR